MIKGQTKLKYKTKEIDFNNPKGECDIFQPIRMISQDGKLSG